VPAVAGAIHPKSDLPMAVSPFRAAFALAPFSLLLPAQQQESLQVPEPTSLAAAVTGARDPAAAAGPAEAWQTFRRTVPGSWRADWCAATGTPAAIFGTGLPIADWRGNTLEEARRQALRVLREHDALLGLGTSEFREIIGHRMGRTWSFTFDQYFRGIPVIDGRADVRVSSAGRIAMFGSKAWPIAADFTTVPTIGDDTATAIAWNESGAVPSKPHAGKPRTNRLVIWGDVHAATAFACRLAWEIPICALDRNGNGLLGRYYVDAHTGAVLRYESDRHDCGIAGCTGNHAGRTAGDTPAPVAAADSVAAVVTPPAVEGTAPPPALTTVTFYSNVRIGPMATSPAVLQAVPGLHVNVNGQVYDTNANGVVTFDLQAPAALTVPFDGIHMQAIQGSDGQSAVFTANPGSVIGAAMNVLPTSDVQLAHSNTYFTVHGINEWCRTLFGANTPQLVALDSILPTVNDTSDACNAYYTNNTITFYTAGGGCANSAMPTIIAHEWGHGLDDQFGGMTGWNGLQEAWADICALYYFDYPNLGEGLSATSFVRTGNNNRQFPQGGTFHEKGESFMGFAWKVREYLAGAFGRPASIALSNDIVLGTIVANADDQVSAVREVFLADDDDGNLTNGTPHSTWIQFACYVHSLPLPWTIPANDECSGAITLFEGLNGPYDNTNCTVGSGWDGADLWFRYTTGVAGPLTISTCGQANFDTYIEVYSGTCGGLTSLGYWDDQCSEQASATLTVAPGNYYVRIGGKVSLASYGWFNEVGTFQVQVTGPTGGAAYHQYFGAGCTGSYPGPYPFLWGGDPRYGTQVELYTDPIPYGAGVGINVLGLNSFPSGVPFDTLGAPGCALYVDPVVLDVVFPHANWSYRYWLTIPQDVSLQGVEWLSQFLVLAPAANPFGFVFTDAVRMGIGN